MRSVLLPDQPRAYRHHLIPGDHDPSATQVLLHLLWRGMKAQLKPRLCDSTVSEITERGFHRLFGLLGFAELG